MKRHLQALVLPLLVLVLTAAKCDGPPNVPPVADAGENQSAALGQTVTLDGSGSSDPDGDPLSFRWRFTATPEGSDAALADLSKTMTSFTPDLGGEYRARLTVSDGQTEAEDEVVVSVAAPPIADAGADRAVTVGERVVLDGGGSSNPEDGSLTYLWTLNEIPNGSAATLTDPGAAKVSFVPDVAGAYHAILTVSNRSASATDKVTVTAVEMGNRPPVADAGPPQTVTAGDEVSLNGGGSSDPDGDALSYSWSFLTWPERNTLPAPDLSDARAASPSFTATTMGSYTLELTVSDGELSDSARVTVTAEPGTAVGTLYISTTGNDAQRGTEDQPLRTLNKALMVAHESKDISGIFLFNGTYSEGEPFDYSLTRNLFIQGESQSGVMLEASEQDIFTLERPEGSSGTVKLYLTDLTFKTTGTGVSLRSNTEANLARVTCLGADPCALAADVFGFIPIAGGTLTLRDSLLTGPGRGNGLKILAGGHLVENTTIENYDNGIDALGAGFLIIGGTLRNNARGLNLKGTLEGEQVRVKGGNLENNGYGIYAEDAALSLSEVDIKNSDTNGIYVLGEKEIVLANVTITGSGTSGVHAEGPLMNVVGGSFSDNAYGFFLAGSSTLVADNITAQDNSVSGVVLSGEASLTLRGSKLRSNDLLNLQILGSPIAVDLGTQDDPGNNVFEADSMTRWSLSDQRPDLDKADGVVVTAYGNEFVSAGITRSYDAQLELVTGPDSRDKDWRITGVNQRMRF